MSKTTIYSTQDIRERIATSLNQKYYTSKRKELIPLFLIKETTSTILSLIKKERSQKNTETSIRKPVILEAVLSISQRKLNISLLIIYTRNNITNKQIKKITLLSNVSSKRVVNVNEQLRPPTYFHNSLCLTMNNSTNYS